MYLKNLSMYAITHMSSRVNVSVMKWAEANV
jgi:hypothetical protein